MNCQSRFNAGYRMLGAGALGWTRGVGGTGREEGGGSGGNTCTPVAHSCWCMAKPIQHCKEISLQLKQINLFKKKRIARRDKKAFFSDQCKEIEENNRMGKTRDLFKKNERYQGNISCKDGLDRGQKSTERLNWTEQNGRDTCCEPHVTSMLVLSRVWLFATSWTLAPQVPLSMGFSRQEYRIGLPFPSVVDLPDPGIELAAPVLQADSLLLSQMRHKRHKFYSPGSNVIPI